MFMVYWELISPRDPVSFKADCKRRKNKDKMHSIKWTCIVILLQTYTTVQGSTKLTCAPVYQKPSYPVICECEQSSGNDIQWLKDNVIISACVAASGFCSPKPSGYVFSNILAGSVAYYNLTISSYDYSDCGLYTCKDFASPPASDDVLRSLYDFDSNSLQIEEPLANHSNGIINFTTECTFESSNVSDNIKWYKVVNGMAAELDRNQLNVTTDSSSCKQCSGEYASKLIVKYEHTEAHGDNVEEVQFQISMFHDLEKDVVLRRTTKNYYNIKISDGSNKSDRCDECDIKDVIIVVAVAWTSAILLIVVGSCIYKHIYQKKELRECVFDLATIPLILTIIITLLYRQGRKKMILIIFSIVVDVAFIGIVIYICFFTEICELNLFWALLVYMVVCALFSVLKCIIIDKSKRDRNVSDRNSNVKQNDGGENVDIPVSHEHDWSKNRTPLPRIPSVSSRLGNVKEHEHSLKSAYPTHGSRLPPISKQNG